MTKAELVKRVAEAAEVTQKQAAQVLDAFFAVVKDAAASGEEVRIPGFGSFVVRERKARAGRNPQTGEEIVIPARRAVVFKPGKELRDAAERS
ncbi:MAG: HU family DNA-binding protein [Thermacetogeniaceae bacterium]